MRPLGCESLTEESDLGGHLGPIPVADSIPCWSVVVVVVEATLREVSAVGWWLSPLQSSNHGVMDGACVSIDCAKDGTAVVIARLMV